MAKYVKGIAEPVPNASQTVRVTWAGVQVGDTMSMVEYPDMTDRSFQVIGDLGNATLDIHGSLDKENFSILSDPQGNNLQIGTASAKIEQVLQITDAVRPVLNGGNSNTSIMVVMLAKKTK